MRRVKPGTRLRAVSPLKGLIPRLSTRLCNYLQSRAAFEERILNEEGLCVEQEARLLREWVSERASELKGMLTILAPYAGVCAMTLLPQEMGDPLFAMKYMNPERLLMGPPEEKGHGNTAAARINRTVL